MLAAFLWPVACSETSVPLRPFGDAADTRQDRPGESADTPVIFPDQRVGDEPDEASLPPVDMVQDADVEEGAVTQSCKSNSDCPGGGRSPKKLGSW